MTSLESAQLGLLKTKTLRNRITLILRSFPFPPLMSEFLWRSYKRGNGNGRKITTEKKQV